MIELKNINKTYNIKSNNKVQALKDVSLTINSGEMVAIVGKSGAGKSTLLHIMGCIDDADTGEYSLDGLEINGLNDKKKSKIRNQKIGIVMQDFALVEEYSALENVILPIRFSNNKKNKTERAMNVLERVGIEELAKRRVSHLSGGQKQRVAIARALINDPSFLLADEPTGALDVSTSAEIMQLFKKLNDEGMTIVIITHDMDVADACNRKIVIADGKLE